MRRLTSADLSQLTRSTGFFLFLATFISAWGDAIGLTYLVFYLDLNVLALALVLEAIVWAIVTSIQSQIRMHRSENTVLVGTAIFVTILTIINIPLLQQRIIIGFIILFICVRIASQTYRQHALAFIGPIYMARHRRQSLVNILVGSRILAIAVLMAMLLVIDESSLGPMIGVWLVAIALHLLTSLWLEQAAEELATQSPEAMAYTSTVSQPLSPGHMEFLWNHGLSRWLIISTLSIASMSSFVLYEVATVIQAEYDTRLEMMRFFVLSTAAGLIITLPLSYKLLSSLLRQFDAGKLARFFPAFLNIVFFSIMLIPVVPSAFLGQLVPPLRRTIHDPLERLLQRAIPDAEEQLLRSLLQGGIDPFGRAIAGVFLLIIGTSNQPVLVVGIAIGTVFFVSSNRAGFLYGQALAQSLDKGQYRLLRKTTADLTIGDHTYVGNMIERLNDDNIDERELLLVAEVVAGSETEEAYEILVTLWHRSDFRLKAELLPFIINGWPDKGSDEAHRQIIQDSLNSDDNRLRRKALLMISSYPTLDPAYTVARFLIDPDPTIDVLAAWILIRHPSEPVRHAARAQLRWLAKDPSVSTRVTAVTALVNSSLNSFGELTYPLAVESYLNDSATRVREAVLPAANTTELIAAVCDVSADVRRAAIRQIGMRRFQGAIRQFSDTVAHYSHVVSASHNLQIEASLNHWRLLVGFRQLRWHSRQRGLVNDLHIGLQQLDVLDNLIVALTCLERDIFSVVINQLKRDRMDLVNIMIQNLSIVAGESRVETIIWVLKSDLENSEYKVAVEALSNMTTPDIAKQFASELSRRSYDSVSSQQSTLPSVAFNILLSQLDEWRPLLTLFALSEISKEQREQWASPELIVTVLENSLNSTSDVVREGGRLVRHLLDENNDRVRYDLQKHLQQDEEERTLMLSTLERMLFLRNVSFFENLHLDQLRALARGCEEIAAPENEIIIRQGTVGSGLFIVVEGQVRIQLNREGQPPLHVGRLGESEVFGEISLLDGGERSADVITETPVLLLSIRREALNVALEDDPNIAMVMLQSMARRLRRTTELIDEYIDEASND